jgi:hypothetical protein
MEAGSDAMMPSSVWVGSESVGMPDRFRMPSLYGHRYAMRKRFRIAVIKGKVEKIARARALR